MLYLIISLQYNGDSPLYFAAYGGHVEILSVLLSNGASINKTNNVGSTPLHVAANIGHESSVALLLSMGADVNHKRNDGQTPLDAAKTQTIKDMIIAHTKKHEESQWFTAARMGDLSLIQQGINDKFDVNCRDSRGRTAVFWGSQEGHLPFVEYLITYHADLSIATVSVRDAF